MSVYKCKMCGGTILFNPGDTVGVCDSCGTKQTLPKTNDEMISNLFNRANNLRLKNEFDKAEQIYEKIVQMDDSEAEAHWGIVLCKYGIEYVEDPRTHQRIPTCHRTLYEAVTADPDYQAAIDYSDSYQQSIYEIEAKAIDRIQKDILEIVKNEKPFDVFICYKETDETGKRTVDSAIANDIYYQLTQEGFKVFYAPITLEGKLGQEYEPYIFSALNTAKVMLVIGTRPEHFSAVWVKNEWSRYLKLMKTDRSRLLIPCYRDMDAYELPEEFAHLQAQDMGKIGFINDVSRGIKKVLSANKPTDTVKETVVIGGNANAAPLLKRAFMFLEDGDYAKADDFCEQVLNIDPENAQAYLGKLMAEQHVRHQEDLKNCAKPFDGSNSYQKAVRFGEVGLSSVLRGYVAYIKDRNEEQRKTDIYKCAVEEMNAAQTESAYKEAANAFKSIPGFKDSGELADQCLEKAEFCRKDEVYSTALSLMYGNEESELNRAIREFQSIAGWKDADVQIDVCKRRLEELQEKKEAIAQEREKAQKKKKRLITVLCGALVVCIAFAIVLTQVIIPNHKQNADYKSAMELYDAGSYSDAISAFINLEGFKDSEEMILVCKYAAALELYNSGEYSQAEEAFQELDNYENSLEMINNCQYSIAKELYDSGRAAEAIQVFEALNGFKDSAEIVEGYFDSRYNQALELFEAGSYDEAIAVFQDLDGYRDSAEKIESCYIGKYGEEIYNVLKNLNEGDIYAFGSYEQDNNASNGKEQIEWIVLDINAEDASLFLISRYALDCQPFNNTNTYVTWEDCSLRKWLNGAFYNSAFSSNEQRMIQSTNIDVQSNESVSDRIFLLSEKEANSYFTSSAKRMCKGTSYCFAQGAFQDSAHYCQWWLRSSGWASDLALNVGNTGVVNRAGGSAVNADYYAVRPALWIDLDQLD